MTLEHTTSRPERLESVDKVKREAEVLSARGRRGARIRFSRKSKNDWDQFNGPEPDSFITTLRIEREY